MKTAIRESLGNVTIFGGITVKIHVAAVVDENGKRLWAKAIGGNARDLELDARLCGRALVNNAVGYVSCVWQDEISGIRNSRWTDDGSVVVGTEQWKVKIVKHLKTGDYYVSPKKRDVYVLRTTADKMVPAAMAGVDLAWECWKIQVMRAALQPMSERLSAAECAEFLPDFEAACAKITAINPQ